MTSEIDPGPPLFRGRRVIVDGSHLEGNVT